MMIRVKCYGLAVLYHSVELEAEIRLTVDELMRVELKNLKMVRSNHCCCDTVHQMHGCASCTVAVSHTASVGSLLKFYFVCTWALRMTRRQCGSCIIPEA